MRTPVVELYTDNECRLDDSPGHRHANNVAREVATAGAAMALRAVDPDYRGPVLYIHNLDCAEVSAAWLEGRELPILCIDGEIVLEGQGWTEPEVRDALLAVLTGRPEPTERAIEIAERGDARHRWTKRKAEVELERQVATQRMKDRVRQHEPPERRPERPEKRPALRRFLDYIQID